MSHAGALGRQLKPPPGTTLHQYHMLMPSVCATWCFAKHGVQDGQGLTDWSGLTARALRMPAFARRFFGGGGFPGFGGFGGMGDEEEQTPKGHDIHVELEVTLKALYLGHQYKAGISQ